MKLYRASRVIKRRVVVLEVLVVIAEVVEVLKEVKVIRVYSFKRVKLQKIVKKGI